MSADILNSSFGNFIILFLVNEKDRTNLTLNSSWHVAIVLSGLRVLGIHKCRVPKEDARGVCARAECKVLPRGFHFALCPQLGKAPAVSLGYILVGPEFYATPGQWLSGGYYYE